MAQPNLWSIMGIGQQCLQLYQFDQPLQPLARRSQLATQTRKQSSFHPLELLHYQQLDLTVGRTLFLQLQVVIEVVRNRRHRQID